MVLIPDHAPTARESPADRVRLALDLYDPCERMLRQRLRNDEPGIGEDRIEAAVATRLAHRPGAEFGDMPGVPSARFG